MATRGGARPGAGRKPSALTQRTREIAEKAVEGGITPLDFMLEVLRDTGNSRDERMEAAKAAAPYIHPRLAAIEANVTAQLTIGDMLDALD